MPHGYKHIDKASVPFDQAKQLILSCLEVFSRELEGFDPKQSLFAFPHNSSTPEIEKWLATKVRAFRTGGGGLNPLPYKGSQGISNSWETHLRFHFSNPISGK